MTRPTNVGNGASAVAVGAGAVWVANSLDGTVSRIDPASDRVAATIPVGDGPSGVASRAAAVWVSNELAGTLSRIDPARNEVVQTVKTGNRPEGVAPTGDTIYVAVRASGLAHRGGTLTVLRAGALDSIDPATLRFIGPAMILTNDGLTGFRRVGGSDGARLVPDLATSLPTPTDGGRTYTFQLRPGIRYSTGALVRPADFRRAIERALLVNPGYYGPYFGGIVGAAACLKTPKRCDLSQGIVADPVANTVTFHLTAPDPDFLYKLALPAAFAVPAGTPVKARLPLPATGPYMIAGYDPKHRLRLVRNPRFREWSAAAQPSGYPDEIVLTFGFSPEAQVRLVERGEADLAARRALRPRAPVRAPNAVRQPAAHQSGRSDRLLLPQHKGAAVRRRQGAASGQFRRRPKPDGGRALRRSAPLCPAELPGAAAELRRLPALLPLHDRPERRREVHRPRPREGKGARRRLGHERTGRDRLDSRQAARTAGCLLRLRAQEPRLQGPAQSSVRRDSTSTSRSSADSRRKIQAAGAAGSRTTPRRPTSSPRCSPAAPSIPDTATTTTSPSSATRASTPRSPAPARSRPATRRRRASSGARSTATSSTRPRGSSTTTPGRPTSSRAASATTSTTRSGARSSTRSGSSSKAGGCLSIRATGSKR